MVSCSAEFSPILFPTYFLLSPVSVFHSISASPCLASLFCEPFFAPVFSSSVSLFVSLHRALDFVLGIPRSTCLESEQPGTCRPRVSLRGGSSYRYQCSATCCHFSRSYKRRRHRLNLSGDDTQLPRKQFIEYNARHSEVVSNLLVATSLSPGGIGNAILSDLISSRRPSHARLEPSRAVDGAHVVSSQLLRSTTWPSSLTSLRFVLYL